MKNLNKINKEKEIDGWISVLMDIMIAVMSRIYDTEKKTGVYYGHYKEINSKRGI